MPRSGGGLGYAGTGRTENSQQVVSLWAGPPSPRPHEKNGSGSRIPNLRSDLVVPNQTLVFRLCFRTANPSNSMAPHQKPESVWIQFEDSESAVRSGGFQPSTCVSIVFSNHIILQDPIARPAPGPMAMRTAYAG